MGRDSIKRDRKRIKEATYKMLNTLPQYGLLRRVMLNDYRKTNKKKCCLEMAKVKEINRSFLMPLMLMSAYLLKIPIYLSL